MNNDIISPQDNVLGGFYSGVPGMHYVFYPSSKDVMQQII